MDEAFDKIKSGKFNSIPDPVAQTEDLNPYFDQGFEKLAAMRRPGLIHTPRALRSGPPLIFGIHALAAKAAAGRWIPLEAKFQPRII